MHLSFKLKYPNATSIIDCTELFIQKPKNCSAQASTSSNYKSHNTFEALVAIKPDGDFSFVFKFWSGNDSDRKITVDSKFLDIISPGDEVMSDRRSSYPEKSIIWICHLLPMREEMGRGEYCHPNRFLNLAKLLHYAFIWNGLSEDSNPAKC